MGDVKLGWLAEERLQSRTKICDLSRRLEETKERLTKKTKETSDLKDKLHSVRCSLDKITTDNNNLERFLRVEINRDPRILNRLQASGVCKFEVRIDFDNRGHYT